MLDKAAEIFMIASMVLTATIAFLAVIAPATKTDKDNKVLNALRWIETNLMGLLLSLLQKPAAKAALKKADPKA